MNSSSVVVLGAGVVGLSTAVNIQQLIPNVKVTIIAEKWYDETTSHGSGGIFVPSVPETDLHNVHRYRTWCQASGKFYMGLATGPEAGEAGVMVVTGYNLADTDREKDKDPLYRDAVFNHRRLDEQEMKHHGFYRFKYGYEVTTYILDQTKYLKWLQQRFESKGGLIKKQTIKNLTEISTECDVLVNCCGLGSRELFGDSKMFTLKGHIVRVRAPWIKHWYMYYSDTFTYIIPRGDTITLGGIKQPGNESLEPEARDRDGILERCEELCPMIKGAEIDHEWVGLRPCRDGIRLETEQKLVNNGNMFIVHNYGHGSDGVAFSWGTGIEAAQLVQACLNKTTARL